MKRSLVRILMPALCAAAVFSSANAVGQRGATRARVQMPQGPVRNVILKNCTACHGIDDYGYYALDRSGWQALLADKHKAADKAADLTNVAKISAADQAILLDWLADKFGPTTRPFPRTYVAPEIKTFFSDPEAKRLIDRACANCHDTERINQVRNTEEGWRVLTIDMRERGAKLTDEELERLVEWLGRVRGTNQSQ